MTNKLITLIKCTSLVSSISLLCGCMAVQTTLEHRTLETQTQLSKTIFLDPVAPSQKTVFVVVKNTSDQSMNIQQPLQDAFRAQGFKVMNSPSSAHYLLQANILSIGKMSQSAAKDALGHGFGSALAGGVTGAAIGSFGNNANMMLAGGLAGGAIGLVADSLVKDVNYTLVTDVKITEHSKKGTHSFKTRVVSTANKVNLNFSTARPALEAGLVNTLVGIF